MQDTQNLQELLHDVWRNQAHLPAIEAAWNELIPGIQRDRLIYIRELLNEYCRSFHPDHEHEDYSTLNDRIRALSADEHAVFDILTSVNCIYAAEGFDFATKLDSAIEQITA